MKILYTILDPGIPLQGSKGASAHARSLASALNDVGYSVVVAARNTDGSEPLLSKEIRVIKIPFGEPARSLGTLFKESSKELTALLENSNDYNILSSIV